MARVRVRACVRARRSSPPPPQVYDATNKLTTVLYDGIQKLQNDIYSERWE